MLDCFIEKLIIYALYAGTVKRIYTGKQKVKGEIMIRKFKENDLDKVMSIWLNSNLEVHSFVNPDYWKEKFTDVKIMIPQAEVYVSENDGIINGFIGIIGDYIAGIFVNKSNRSTGIGTDLLNLAKINKEKLVLSVYEKNEAAITFYKNAGFKIKTIGIDNDTFQKEYTMIWKR